ncbi:hypothetical protein ABMA27_010199 [Loxostege sticticalis]|uniref:DUF7041 domain-containing protein n=1 Tax=Loxostege sticticalis TaxID=481309 RepID=A0ABR3H3I4_LOXSC
MSEDRDSSDSTASQDGGFVNDRKKGKVEHITGPPGTSSFGEPRQVNLKVPPFSPDEPEIWFALLEGQFECCNIKDDSTKFINVINNLDIQHSKAVKDILLNPPAQNRYNKIKSELIKRLCASKENKVRQLLVHEELGDRKPSQFLRHLQDLAGPSVPADFIKTIWCNRLPQNIQTVLASQPTQPLDQQADLADRIQEITAPCNVAAMSSSSTYANPSSEIAELKKMVEHLTMKLEEHTRFSNCSSIRSRPRERRNSTTRPRSRSNSNYRKHPVCWYHMKFGEKARRCIKPCDYKQAGNHKGSL